MTFADYPQESVPIGIGRSAQSARFLRIYGLRMRHEFFCIACMFTREQPLVHVRVECGRDVRGGHEALLARVGAPHARPPVARVRLQHQ